MSPKVLASAALYALNTDGVSAPYSEWESMVSYNKISSISVLVVKQKIDELTSK